MAATDQNEHRKLELVAQLQESRKSVLGAKLLLNDQLTEKKSALAEFLNLPKRIKKSFTEQPAKSFAVAMASGLAAVLVLKRKPNTQKQHKAVKRSVFSSLALTIARPMLQRLALQYSQQWLTRRTENKLVQSHRHNP